MFKFNRKILIIPLAFVLIILLSYLMSGAEGNEIKVHFLDVGQADATFIQLPNNQTMLIDGGNNEDGSLIDYIKGIKDQEINKIDYLVGTHPHEDHIGGLDEIINAFEIGKIYLPKVTHTTKTFEDLMTAIGNKGLKISTAIAGTEIFNNDYLKLKGIIHSPRQVFYDELNNYSVVIKLTYGDTGYLFTGDAEEVVENELVNNDIDLKANILKVGHHGSESSNADSFIEAVSPQYGVISVGEGNSYGHPSPAVLNRLKGRNVKIYRTDEQGTIIATSDGNKIEFNKDELALEKELSNGEEKEEQTTGIYISNVKLGGSVESVAIKNSTDENVDLSNWKLISETGGQEFIFPQGTEIPPGGQIKVVSGRGAKADPPKVILWNNSYIWNNDGDPAALYNSSGQLVSRFPEE